MAFPANLPTGAEIDAQDDNGKGGTSYFSADGREFSAHFIDNLFYGGTCRDCDGDIYCPSVDFRDDANAMREAQAGIDIISQTA